MLDGAATNIFNINKKVVYIIIIIVKTVVILHYINMFIKLFIKNCSNIVENVTNILLCNLKIQNKIATVKFISFSNIHYYD